MWETLLEMERFTYHAGERDQGAAALVLDFAKAFERVSLCGLGQGMSTFPKTKHVCYAGSSNTSGGCSSEVVWRSRSSPSLATLPGSKWSYLLLRIVLQDALSKVTKIFPPLKLRVFLDVSSLEKKKQGVDGDGRKILMKSKKGRRKWA